VEDSERGVDGASSETVKEVFLCSGMFTESQIEYDRFKRSL
jgi:hypothetical protein